MADLPYTYTDREGAELIVDTTGIFITGATGGCRATDTPTGADAVALARAILAAGDSGYEAVSPEKMEWRLRIAGKNCARDMRERAAETIEFEFPGYYAEEVRVLPLLPDGDLAEDEWPPACAALSPADAGIAPYGCEGPPGHRGDHYALQGAVLWGSEDSRG